MGGADEGAYSGGKCVGRCQKTKNKKHTPLVSVTFQIKSPREGERKARKRKTLPDTCLWSWLLFEIAFEGIPKGTRWH